MKPIGQYIWTGFWQGIGVEVSFFLLFVGWHLLHGRIANKFDPEHFVHKIHDYFK